jgi:hypothetical protein
MPAASAPVPADFKKFLLDDITITPFFYSLPGNAAWLLLNFIALL